MEARRTKGRVVSEGPQEPGTEPEDLAPLGGPAEAEPPVHSADLDAGTTLEDSVAYQLAVEDGAPLAASGDDPGAGPLAPEFRVPGAP